jgi:hypothetical protein
MRPPWFEPGPALAAAGHVYRPSFRDYFRKPVMAHDARYALVREPDSATHKPSIYPALHNLAKAIQRGANYAPIQLEDAFLQFQGEATPRRGVNVWRLDRHTGDRTAFIGWAWLDGGDRYLLTAAMPRQSAGVAAIRAA